MDRPAVGAVRQLFQLELRGNAGGALIADTLSASAAFTYAERDGFTTNDVTSQNIDY